jgi:hypothetical protein
MQRPVRLSEPQRHALYRILDADRAGEVIDTEDWGIALGEIVLAGSESSDTARVADGALAAPAVPLGPSTPDATPPDNESVKLPARIRDVEEWGRTRVEHGRAQRGRSYSEAAADKGYRTWVLDNCNANSSVFLQDFRDYLLALGHGRHVCAYFPGTAFPRTFVAADVKQ